MTVFTYSTYLGSVNYFSLNVTLNICFLRVCCHDLLVILFNIITQWCICYVNVLFLCEYGSNLCECTYLAKVLHEPV